MNLALSNTRAVDADWIGACRAGDMAVWRALYDRYLPQVYRVAHRLGVPERELPDLCQEVFLRVYRGLGGFRGEAQFSTWLYRITVNEAARLGRAGSLRNAVLSWLGREPTARDLPRPDEALAQAQQSRALAHILAALKPKQRQVFVLFEIEELSLEQIATILACPLETVRSRLRHARQSFARLARQQHLTAVPAPVPQKKVTP